MNACRFEYYMHHISHEADTHTHSPNGNENFITWLIKQKAFFLKHSGVHSICICITVSIGDLQRKYLICLLLFCLWNRVKRRPNCDEVYLHPKFIAFFLPWMSCSWNFMGCLRKLLFFIRRIVQVTFTNKNHFNACFVLRNHPTIDLISKHCIEISIKLMWSFVLN